MVPGTTLLLVGLTGLCLLLYLRRRDRRRARRQKKFDYLQMRSDL